MTWKPENFLIAQAYGPETVVGYTYRGVGLHVVIKASPKGRRPPTWSVTHLGSGLRVALVRGTVAAAFPAATDIAECGDWDFDGIDGWRNRDPELPKKLVEACAKHKNASPKAGGPALESTANVVRQIVMARA